MRVDFSELQLNRAKSRADQTHFLMEAHKKTEIPSEVTKLLGFSNERLSQRSF